MDEFAGALVTTLAWIARFLWHVVFDAVFDFVLQAVAGLVMWPFRRRDDAPANTPAPADDPTGRPEPEGLRIGRAPRCPAPRCGPPAD